MNTNVRLLDKSPGSFDIARMLALAHSSPGTLNPTARAASSSTAEVSSLMSSDAVWAARKKVDLGSKIRQVHGREGLNRRKLNLDTYLLGTYDVGGKLRLE